MKYNFIGVYLCSMSVRFFPVLHPITNRYICARGLIIQLSLDELCYQARIKILGGF